MNGGPDLATIANKPQRQPLNLLRKTHSLRDDRTKYSAGPVERALGTARYGDGFSSTIIVVVRRRDIEKKGSSVLVYVGIDFCCVKSLPDRCLPHIGTFPL